MNGNCSDFVVRTSNTNEAVSGSNWGNNANNGVRPAALLNIIC